MNKDKKPLYRKVNTKVPHLGFHHDYGGDYKHYRNSKKSETIKMVKGKLRGLDFTPLYKFIQSKEGCLWDGVQSEALSRLPAENKDQIEMLFDEKQDIVRLGENSYYHSMYVDDEGRLRFRNKSAQLIPTCTCHQWTLNGKVIELNKNKEGEKIW